MNIGSEGLGDSWPAAFLRSSAEGKRNQCETTERSAGKTVYRLFTGFFPQIHSTGRFHHRLEKNL